MLSATFEFEISSYFGLLNSSLRLPLLPPLHIATWQQVTDKSRSAPYCIWKASLWKSSISPPWLPVRILDQRSSLMSAFSYFVFQWTLTFAVTSLSGCSTSIQWFYISAAMLSFPSLLRNAQSSSKNKIPPGEIQKNNNNSSKALQRLITMERLTWKPFSFSETYLRFVLVRAL